MREGLELARKNGVDPGAVVNMLTTTLFNAPIYQSYGKRDCREKLFFQPVPNSGERYWPFQGYRRRVDMPTPIADVLQVLLRKDAGLT